MGDLSVSDGAWIGSNVGRNLDELNKPQNMALATQHIRENFVRIPFGTGLVNYLIFRRFKVYFIFSEIQDSILRFA